MGVLNPWQNHCSGLVQLSFWGPTKPMSSRHFIEIRKTAIRMAKCQRRIHLYAVDNDSIAIQASQICLGCRIMRRRHDVSPIYYKLFLHDGLKAWSAKTVLMIKGSEVWQWRWRLYSYCIIVPVHVYKWLHDDCTWMSDCMTIAWWLRDDFMLMADERKVLF